MSEFTQRETLICLHPTGHQLASRQYSKNNLFFHWIRKRYPVVDGIERSNAFVTTDPETAPDPDARH